MPIKINELVIKLKVFESNNQKETSKEKFSNLFCVTEQEKLSLKKELLNILEDQKTR